MSDPIDHVEALRRIGAAADAYELNHPYGAGVDFLRRVREAIAQVGPTDAQLIYERATREQNPWGQRP